MMHLAEHLPPECPECGSGTFHYKIDREVEISYDTEGDLDVAAIMDEITDITCENDHTVLTIESVEDDDELINELLDA